MTEPEPTPRAAAHRAKFDLDESEASTDSVQSSSSGKRPRPAAPEGTCCYRALYAIFAHRYRYFILVLGCLCLTSICSNMITLNFTLICMDKSYVPGGNDEDSDASKIVQARSPNDNFTFDNSWAGDIPRYDYTLHEKSLLMWAVAIGSIVGTFPFNYLYAHCGARYVFFAAGFISSVATLAIPTAAEIGFDYFLAARVLQGISYSADFAAIGVLCSRWASLKQNGFFLSILTCFSPISSAVTNPISGYLCESSYGWPSVYYAHGGVSLFLFVLWLFTYTDHPETHHSVSAVELEKIHRDKSGAHIKMDSFVPYWQIIKNPIVLIIWANALADIGSGIFLLTYTPTYIKRVLHYSVEETGWLGAMPALSHIPVKLFTGYISDKWHSFAERKKMIMFNSVALLAPGFLYACLGYVPEDHPSWAIVLFTVIHAFLGANCGGFYKCATLIARQYSAFVIANIQFIKCITLFIAPALVAVFVQDESSRDQWRNIFFVMALFLVFVNILFCIVATDAPAEFTLITRETVAEEKAEKRRLRGNAVGDMETAFDSKISTKS